MNPGWFRPALYGSWAIISFSSFMIWGLPGAGLGLGIAMLVTVLTDRAII